ncbi:MAG: M20/M25/M40 family metallo-hydrolase [Candidatus Sumerlaeia bacterium]
MKRAFILLPILMAMATAARAGTTEPLALARVEVTGDLRDIQLPIYAHLLDASGREYALVKAAPSRLKQLKAPHTIIDPDARGASFAIASWHKSKARPSVAGIAQSRHDDGRHMILRADPAGAAALAAAGLELQWLAEPLVLASPPSPMLAGFTTDARVKAMIDKVSQSTLTTLVGNLSGENSVTVSGSPFTIASRSTYSGTYVTKATQYAYEYMQGKGLTASFHKWSNYRNVVAEKTGITRPAEIVLVTAHLDDMPSSTFAPGADDNASGVAAVMHAAAICAGRDFERTIRFALFTGEEQGLLGSYAYAETLYSGGENIVAVFNMDMIAYDATGGPTIEVHTRLKNNPGYAADAAIAGLLTSVVQGYGLSTALSPVIIADGVQYSDHYSFWRYGYAGALMIEDENDFTPYYHMNTDRLSTLNPAFLKNAAKAAVGVIGHLAVPAEKNAVRAGTEWYR